MSRFDKGMILCALLMGVSLILVLALAEKYRRLGLAIKEENVYLERQIQQALDAYREATTVGVQQAP